MHTDPIADMLTRIRNAQMTGSGEVLIPRSNIKFQIADLLKQEGYISEVREVEEAKRQYLKLKLKYYESKPVIVRIQRISKPGQRVYAKAKNIPQVSGGLGILIMSTSKGILAGHEAKKQQVGGEVICEIY